MFFTSIKTKVMDTQKNQDELNQEQSQDQSQKKGGIHNNALYAASMGRAATAQVNPHDNSGLAQTGTNISYEGATAPGSGGSAGTGYTSGQPATGASISTDSDYDQAGVGTTNRQDISGSGSETDAEDELNEQR
jgi:hypothetical protein